MRHSVMIILLYLARQSKRRFHSEQFGTGRWRIRHFKSTLARCFKNVHFQDVISLWFTYQIAPCQLSVDSMSFQEHIFKVNNDVDWDTKRRDPVFWTKPMWEFAERRASGAPANVQTMFTAQRCACRLVAWGYNGGGFLTLQVAPLARVIMRLSLNEYWIAVVFEYKRCCLIGIPTQLLTKWLRKLKRLKSLAVVICDSYTLFALNLSHLRMFRFTFIIIQSRKITKQIRFKLYSL